MSADWNKIKTEYITTDISYRKLAEKYDLDQATIARRAKREDWVSERQQNASKTQAKIIAKISNRRVDRMSRIEDITDKLLDKIEQAVSELDLKITIHKVKEESATTETTTEWREAEEGGVVDRTGLRQITAALKDLKEIQKIRADKDEQDARIQNLRRQAAYSDDDENETGVILLASVLEQEDGDG